MNEIEQALAQISAYWAKERATHGEPMRERIASVIIRETVGEIAPYGDAMDTYLRAADAVLLEIERTRGTAVL